MPVIFLANCCMLGFALGELINGRPSISIGIILVVSWINNFKLNAPKGNCNA